MSPLEEFHCLLKESNQFPKDELRDYYLVPAKALISSNCEIATQVYNDKTALFMVVEQLIRKNNHSIREIHLNELAVEVVERTPKNILNFQNQDGNSVIHLTTERECFSVGVLDLMKEMGANFSLINKNGQTPLIKVASTDSLDDLKFIHAYTSPRLLNHRDFITGSSALMTAVKEKKINNVFFLLEVGCDLFVRDNTGSNILDLYKSQEYKDSCEISYYKELEEIIELFYLKQKTEQTLKKLSSGA